MQPRRNPRDPEQYETDRDPGWGEELETERDEDEWSLLMYTYQDQIMVVQLADGTEQIYPSTTQAWSAKHGDRYPLGAYAPGDELFIDVGGEWGDALVISRVFEIPEENMDAFVKKFEKMAKKAAKLGAEEPRWAEIGKTFKDKRTPGEIKRGDEPYYRTYTQVIVRGEGPKLKGWEFIATIDPGEGDLGEMFLVNVVPGKRIPDRFKDRGQIDPRSCEHCGKRRYRKKSFILEKPLTGGSIQVGSSCIKDFLGHRSPQAIAAYLQWLAEPVDEDLEREGGGGWGHQLYFFDTRTFLAWTARMIEEFGWLSRSKARESDLEATANAVYRLIYPPSKPQQEVEQANFKALVTDADWELADRALEWSPALWAPDANGHVSDYGQNMEVALSVPKTSYRTAGYVASLIPAYKRAVEEELKSRFDKRGESEHIGVVGEVVELPAMTLVSREVIENDWGTTKLLKFKTDDGNEVVWWYSGHDTYVEGVRYGGSAKVKKHGSFRGVKDTTIQRANLHRLDHAFVSLSKAQVSMVRGLVPEVDHFSQYPEHYSGDFFRYELEALEEQGIDTSVVLIQGNLLAIRPGGRARAEQLVGELKDVKRAGKLREKIEAALEGSEV